MIREFSSNLRMSKLIYQQRDLGIAHVGEDASALIREKIQAGTPLMVGRLGATELRCILNYMFIHQPDNIAHKALEYLLGRIGPFWWGKRTVEDMHLLSGFFPSNPQTLTRFAEFMLAELAQVDILGAWLGGEYYLDSFMPTAIKLDRRELEPYRHNQPWSEALEDKTVLVIHPFADSIMTQYRKRELLFTDKNVLPDFELKTIKAVQSIAGQETEFPDWFAALDHMCRQIDRVDFDIALIGCGAYGLPLATYVKKLGRQSIHLGGALQMLFGIKGKRYEDDSAHNIFINEHWVSPLDSERPPKHTLVEGGCYW